MAKISVSIEALLKEYPFLERIEKVGELGLPGFEFLSWERRDISAIREKAEKNGLEVVTFIGSDHGALVKKEQRESALKSLEEAIKVAHQLNCSTLMIMAGGRDKNIPYEKQIQGLIEGMKEASKIAEREKVTLVIEALNTLKDHPGYLLDSAKEGFCILKEINSPNVKLLYDIYHMQIMEGNLIETISENIDLIGHIHAASVPGRYEPGSGEINYANVIKKLDELGYQGYVGLEYRATMPSMESIRETLKNFGQ